MPEPTRPDGPNDGPLGAHTQPTGEQGPEAPGTADGDDPGPGTRSEPGLDMPQANPVPMVLAAIAAVTVAIILVMVFVAGDGAGDDQTAAPLDQPVVIEVGDSTTPTVGGPLPETTFAYLSVEGGDAIVEGGGDASPESEGTGGTSGEVEGEQGSFADFAGQPLVLNFFASWCAPCIKEMPELQMVSEQYAGEVAFLGMATRDTASAAEGVVARTGVTYPTSMDPDGSIATALRVMAMPGTVFIDADGNVQRVWLGPISADEVSQIIDRHLLS